MEIKVESGYIRRMTHTPTKGRMVLVTTDAGRQQFFVAAIDDDEQAEVAVQDSPDAMPGTLKILTTLNEGTIEGVRKHKPLATGAVVQWI